MVAVAGVDLLDRVVQQFVDAFERLLALDDRGVARSELPGRASQHREACVERQQIAEGHRGLDDGVAARQQQRGAGHGDDALLDRLVDRRAERDRVVGAPQLVELDACMVELVLFGTGEADEILAAQHQQ